ncbi:Hypothetical protein POVN_LOCUS637, partial [uncultured virus]
VDRVARYHDIGLYLAGLESGDTSAASINWASSKLFFKKGSFRGYFAGTMLFLGVITCIGTCYAGCGSAATEAQLVALHNLLDAAKVDAVSTTVAAADTI